MSDLPDYVSVALWSYDIKKIDLQRDRHRIIVNILNVGSTEAVKWLFENYSQEDISLELLNPLVADWNKKSLNFWCLRFGIVPKVRTRF